MRTPAATLFPYTTLFRSFESASLEEIIRKSSGGVFNNAAQVWNHTFSWNCLSPNGGGEPDGALAEAINRSEQHTSELQSRPQLRCRLLPERQQQTRTER